MQGANRCVYVPLQDAFGNSALHYLANSFGYASSSELESIVAKLLSLGADAALVDKVRACWYMNTCMYISLYVFIRMKGSCSNLYPSLHLCMYMHSAHAHTLKVAFLHVRHVHACPHHAPTNIRCPLQNGETYNIYLFSRIYCTSYI